MKKKAPKDYSKLTTEQLVGEFRQAVRDYAYDNGHADGQASATDSYHYFSADASEADAIEAELISRIRAAGMK